jgi:hypothetical protein
VLAYAIVQTLSQAASLAVRDLGDFLIEPFAFGHFALQRKGAVPHALI